MRFDEYRNLDGVALAKLVADGKSPPPNCWSWPSPVPRR